MIDVTDLPTVNVTLNSASAVLLVTGYLAIRTGRILLHKICMLSALVVSGGFLASYLYYHFHVGHVEFRGEDWVRWVYFPLLISHILLAIVIAPLALFTAYLGLKADSQSPSPPLRGRGVGVRGLVASQDSPPHPQPLSPEYGGEGRPMQQRQRNWTVRHIRIARWTLPLWLYVSITGVVVYVMLYRLYPST